MTLKNTENRLKRDVQCIPGDHVTMLLPDNNWKIPPLRLSISKKQVHVWCVFLDQRESRIRQLETTLSDEEKTRAERFHFQKDRDHFIVARGVLRDILSRYLKRQAEQLSFCYNDYGKPKLAEDSKRLNFNVSHSGGIALYTVTCGREVGIDVEQIRPDFAEEPIAERFFSQDEVAVFCDLESHEKKEAFFNCWTRKEAFIKATGKGVSFGLDNFDVCLVPGKSAALLSVKGDREEARRWSLINLDIKPGYKAALAVEGHDWRLRSWQWQPFEQTIAFTKETNMSNSDFLFNSKLVEKRQA